MRFQHDVDFTRLLHLHYNRMRNSRPLSTSFAKSFDAYKIQLITYACSAYTIYIAAICCSRLNSIRCAFGGCVRAYGLSAPHRRKSDCVNRVSQWSDHWVATNSFDLTVSIFSLIMCDDWCVQKLQNCSLWMFPFEIDLRMSQVGPRFICCAARRTLFHFVLTNRQ